MKGETWKTKEGEKPNMTIIRSRQTKGKGERKKKKKRKKRKKIVN